MTNFTIGNLSDPKERQAIEELQTLIPMISNQKNHKKCDRKKGNTEASQRRQILLDQGACR
jgi:hypothetical protein